MGSGRQQVFRLAVHELGCRFHAHALRAVENAVDVHAARMHDHHAGAVVVHDTRRQARNRHRDIVEVVEQFQLGQRGVEGGEPVRATNVLEEHAFVVDRHRDQAGDREGGAHGVRVECRRRRTRKHQDSGRRRTGRQGNAHDRSHSRVEQATVRLAGAIEFRGRVTNDAHPLRPSAATGARSSAADCPSRPTVWPCRRPDRSPYAPRPRRR